MGRKIKLTFSSTKTRSKGGNTASKARQSANLSPLLYRTLRELPLDRFITCICDDDLTALVKNADDFDRVKPEELILCWNDLFLDYIDLSQDSQTRYKITLKRDIAIFDARVAQIESSLTILGTPLFVKRVADHVQGIKGFEDIELDPADMDKYFADLQLIYNRSRELHIDSELKKIELEELLKSEELQASKKSDRATFLNILSHIATYRKVAVIRTGELTVEEFCAAFTEYLDYCNAVKLSMSKNKKTSWS